VISIGITMVPILASDNSNHFEGDVIIDNGALGIGATPSGIQIIKAESTPGNSAVFLVVGNNGEAIFNLMATTGIPALQLTDGDNGQAYRMRISQPGERLEFVDITAGGNNIRMVIDNAGNVGIDDITPQEKLDVNGNIRLTGNIVSPNDICIGNCP